MMPVALAETIRYLWRYGVPVVAWARDGEQIALCCMGGVVGWITQQDLATAPAVLAARLASELPRRSTLETPPDPSQVPEISMKTLAWWEFLRYIVLEGERPDHR